MAEHRDRARGTELDRLRAAFLDLADFANAYPAVGRKCARSWRIVADVGADPAYPDLSARDAAAVREFDAAAAAGGAGAG